MENNVLLDANAILRFLLDDIHEQHEIIMDAIENKECIAVLPSVQEAVFVLEGYYGVPREEICQAFLGFKDIIKVEDEDVYVKAFDCYMEKPKLDFVDCILYAYHTERGLTILSFDNKLNKKIQKADNPAAEDEDL